MDAIVVVSNEPWGDIWYCKQHYAHELSQLGHNVYFIDPVIRWRFQDLISFRITTKQIEPNLTVVSYHNNFPVRLFPKLFVRLNDWLNSRKLKRVFKQQRILWWQFDHLRLVSLGVLNAMKRIYHIADPIMEAAFDHPIARAADLIVCTSPKYLPFYSQYQAPKLYVPHCISSEDFVLDDKRVQEIKDQYPHCMVLIGSIHHDVDFDMLNQLMDHVEVPLLVIGGEGSMDEADKEAWQRLQEKVVYIGPVHAKELKHYIAAASFCLIPYRFDLKKKVGTGSPLKALHYLAQHKTIITSIDSEIESLEGRAIYWAVGREDFIQFVQKGLADELSVDEAAVDQYLKEHMYGAAIDKILATLNRQE